MIDKLRLVSRNCPYKDFLTTLKPLFEHVTLGRSKVYKQKQIFRGLRGVDSELVYQVCWDSEPGHPYQTAIETNPRKFHRAETLNQLLRQTVSPDQLIVQRIDLAVDIGFEIEAILNGLYVPRKQIHERFKSGGVTGFVCGAGLQRIVIYAKCKATPLTRIEARYYGAKVPIRNYSEIEDLKYYNPFKGIIFFDQSLIRKCISSHETLKSNHLSENILMYGFSVAFSRLNGCRNFWRDYSFLKKECTLELNLNEKFQSQITEYFSVKHLSFELGGAVVTPNEGVLPSNGLTVSESDL